MVIVLLIAFGGAAAVCLLVGLVADRLADRRGGSDRLAVRVLPGHLPSYVRQDLAHSRSRTAVSRGRHSKPPED